MPSGPFGVPRPFASNSIEDKIVFMGELSSSSEVNIPSKVGRLHNIKAGDQLGLNIYHMPQEVVNSNRSFKVRSSVTSDGRVRISQDMRRMLSMDSGDTMMIVVEEILS